MDQKLEAMLVTKTLKMATNNIKIIELIEKTLTQNNIDYNSIIDGFGQLDASKKRGEGHEFTLSDHVKALLLSQLSNQRSWGGIAKNLKNLKIIFQDYNPEKLKESDTNYLLENIREIKCGNRKIKYQILNLRENIKQFEKIVTKYGSMDNFINLNSAEQTAELLSNPKSEYKIKELGFTLAMEYLRNVGVRSVKPDLHILRICGTDRLDLFPLKTNPLQATQIFNEFCKDIERNTTYVDNLVWIFGAKDYANICSKVPKCELCLLRTEGLCNFKNDNGLQ